jgi:tetratricopeptide (TPR) repeat protein
VTRCILALALVVGMGCGQASPSRPTPLTEALFEVAREWTDVAANESAARAELDRLAAAVRAKSKQQPTLPLRTALVTTLFGEQGFVREVDDTDLRFVLLPAVLQHRRGSCVGLGSLVLALGERLGLSVHGVMVPGHFFVRVEEQGARANLELLHRGEEMPDAWYAGRFPIPGGGAREYARELTRDEVRGVVEYDVGNDRRRRGDLHEAQRAYDLARRHFPDFAEAHASAGAIAQLLGSLDRAATDYEAAQRANPNLPGLDQNVQLLESERAGATKP